MFTTDSNPMMKDFLSLKVMKFNIDMVYNTLYELPDFERAELMSYYLIPLEAEYNLLKQSIYN